MAGKNIEAIRAANPGNVIVEGDKVIVGGAAQFTGSGALGHKSDRAQRVEDAMSAAVMMALDDGHSISDSETILAYKRWARATALQALGEKVDVPETPKAKR